MMRAQKVNNAAEFGRLETTILLHQDMVPMFDLSICTHHTLLFHSYDYNHDITQGPNMFCITLTLLFFCLSMYFCVVDHYFFLSCSCLSFNSNVCSFRAPRLTQIKLPCCDAHALSKTLKKTRKKKKTDCECCGAVIIHAVVVLLVGKTGKQNESRKGVVQRRKSPFLMETKSVLSCSCKEKSKKVKVL